MPGLSHHRTIVLAEDDPDDRLLLELAFRKSGATEPLVFVEDGEELLDYLYGRGRWVPAPPRPDLILLDLNMPRKDGREALAEIKADPDLCRIPVVVVTTSNTPEDIQAAYELGANSYLCKPGAFDALVAAVGALVRWWFQTASLPRDATRPA